MYTVDPVWNMVPTHPLWSAVRCGRHCPCAIPRCLSHRRGSADPVALQGDPLGVCPWMGDPQATGEYVLVSRRCLSAARSFPLLCMGVDWRGDSRRTAWTGSPGACRSEARG